MIGILVRTLFILSAMLLAAGTVTAQNNFYQGKTITMVVPYGTGGGTDTIARIVAPYFEEHLGDDVSIQVKNVPGAGGITGMNEYYLITRDDGMTIAWSSASNVMPYVLRDSVVRYDFANMRAILTAPLGRVVYASPELGIDSAADMLNTEGLVHGAVSSEGSDLLPFIAYELLGVDVQMITGYDGSGATRIALERGETNLDMQSAAAYQANIEPMVEEGRAVPMFSLGILDENGDLGRDPTFPDIPSVKEIYVEMHGEEPSGQIWDAYKAALAAQTLGKVLWVHNDAPQEAIDALLAGAESLVQDEEFRDAARAEVGDYPFYVGDAADRVFSAATNASEESISWLQNFIQEQQ